MKSVSKRRKPIPGSLTMKNILDANIQFGPLNYQMVKTAMGANWPEQWDRLGPGEGIFVADEVRS